MKKGRIITVKRKGKNIKTMIEGLLGVVDGLVKLLSFGFLFSDFQYKFMFNRF